MSPERYTINQAKKTRRKKTKMKKLIALILSVLLLVMALAGCQPAAAPAAPEAKTESAKTEEAAATSTEADATTDAAPAELPALRVGVMPILCSLPAYYVKKMGWDVENGFDLQLDVHSLGVTINEAMAAKLLDAGTIGAAGAFTVANFDGILIGEILNGMGGTGVYVRADSDIAKVSGQIADHPEILGSADLLKGKTILGPTGSTQHCSSLKYLETFDLTSEDASLVTMNESDAFQAFKAGEGDMVSFGPPWSFYALQEGWALAFSCSQIGYKVYDGLYANSRTYNEKKELLAKFLKLFYEASDVLAADPEMAVNELVEFQVSAGREENYESAKLEVEARPLVTTEEIKAKDDLGESIRNMAEFFVLAGSLEPDALEKFNSTSLTREIIDMAYGIK